MTGENEDMVEYLRGEIKCMKEVNFNNLVRLHHFDKDDDFYYMLL